MTSHPGQTSARQGFGFSKLILMWSLEMIVLARLVEELRGMLPRQETLLMVLASQVTPEPHLTALAMFPVFGLLLLLLAMAPLAALRIMLTLLGPHPPRVLLSELVILDMLEHQPVIALAALGELLCLPLAQEFPAPLKRRMGHLGRLPLPPRLLRGLA